MPRGNEKSYSKSGLSGLFLRLASESNSNQAAAAAQGGQVASASSSDQQVADVTLLADSDDNSNQSTVTSQSKRAAFRDKYDPQKLVVDMTRNLLVVLEKSSVKRLMVDMIDHLLVTLGKECELGELSGELSIDIAIGLLAILNKEDGLALIAKTAKSLLMAIEEGGLELAAEVVKDLLLAIEEDGLELAAKMAEDLLFYQKNKELHALTAEPGGFVTTRGFLEVHRRHKKSVPTNDPCSSSTNQGAATSASEQVVFASSASSNKRPLVVLNREEDASEKFGANTADVAEGLLKIADEECKFKSISDEECKFKEWGADMARNLSLALEGGSKELVVDVATDLLASLEEKGISKEFGADIARDLLVALEEEGGLELVSDTVRNLLLAVEEGGLELAAKVVKDLLLSQDNKGLNIVFTAKSGIQSQAFVEKTYEMITEQIVTANDPCSSSTNQAAATSSGGQEVVAATSLLVVSSDGNSSHCVATSVSEQIAPVSSTRDEESFVVLNEEKGASEECGTNMGSDFYAIPCEKHDAEKLAIDMARDLLMALEEGGSKESVTDIVGNFLHFLKCSGLEGLNRELFSDIATGLLILSNREGGLKLVSEASKNLLLAVAAEGGLELAAKVVKDLLLNKKVTPNEEGEDNSQKLVVDTASHLLTVSEEDSSKDSDEKYDPKELLVDMVSELLDASIENSPKDLMESIMGNFLFRSDECKELGGELVAGIVRDLLSVLHKKDGIKLVLRAARDLSVAVEEGGLELAAEEVRNLSAIHEKYDSIKLVVDMAKNLLTNLEKGGSKELVASTVRNFLHILRCSSLKESSRELCADIATGLLVISDKEGGLELVAEAARNLLSVVKEGDLELAAKMLKDLLLNKGNGGRMFVLTARPEAQNQLTSEIDGLPAQAVLENDPSSEDVMVTRQPRGTGFEYIPKTPIDGDSEKKARPGGIGFDCIPKAIIDAAVDCPIKEVGIAQSSETSEGLLLRPPYPYGEDNEFVDVPLSSGTSEDLPPPYSSESDEPIARSSAIHSVTNLMPQSVLSSISRGAVINITNHINISGTSRPQFVIGASKSNVPIGDSEHRDAVPPTVLGDDASGVDSDNSNVSQR